MNKPSTSSDIEKALGSLSPGENRRLKELWDSLPEERSEFDEADVESVWNNVVAVSSTEVTTREKRTLRLRLVRSRRIWLSIAATFLIAAAGLAWWKTPIVRYAPPGQRLTHRLPDGSVAELNSGSSIEHARSFSSGRHVQLEGEAFFDVAKGIDPFVITTFNSSVQVLGTQFNVRSWKTSIDPSTTVALASGHVLFSSLNDSSIAYRMTPGQLRIIGGRESNTLSNDTLTVKRAMAWRTGDLFFKDELFGVAIEHIERYFDIDIRVSSQSLLETKFTYNPDLRDSETVIRELSSALGVHYRPILNGYEIY